jgi:anti-sigma B factor antagonist
MPLKVNVEEKSPGVYTIKPEGTIDANTHAALGSAVEALLKKSPTVIVFNMAKVTFVSSAGISVVLNAEKTLRPRGGRVLLVELIPPVKKVFEIVRALPAQQVFSSLAEMDEYLALIHRKVVEGEIS